ncbi:uncharacterized protein LOC115736648 [Rhodamnia argentea]|uniref:Uncharacterized protein LOC115736648 n=1 Tax=Rhodamnia argentea TaxID=178133 RepID=A0A8B8NP64_9MYRT|nr:uncharacterized protein LOC115736648 [Rhodamnia argentea]
MANDLFSKIAPEDVPALSSVFSGRNLAVAFVFVLVGLISSRNYKHCSYLWMWRPRRICFRHVFGGRLLWVGIAFAPRQLCLVLNRIFCHSTDDTSMPSDPNNVEDRLEMPDNATSNRVSTLDEAELKELMSHITESDGGPPWQLMMDKTTPTLTYQAWCRDPPVGPTRYCTRTVFTGVSPELLRDFFWDDEFRLKWEKMLVSCRTLHVCPRTGTMVVHWIRKLPLIRTEREYVIVRRIWQSESRYYCVTKGTTCPSLPNRRNTRRVEVYYSSWCINPVGSGSRQQQPASEVILFHHEDIGVRKEIVKMCARAGMWGLVKKMEGAVQAYNLARASSTPRSSYAILACMTTKCGPLAVPAPYLEVDKDEKLKGRQRKDVNVLKWLVVGGVLIASGLTLQVTGKVVLFQLGKWMTQFSRAKEDQQKHGITH